MTKPPRIFSVNKHRFQSSSLRKLIAAKHCGPRESDNESNISDISHLYELRFQSNPEKGIDFLLCHQDDPDSDEKRNRIKVRERDRFKEALTEYGIDVEEDEFERDDEKIFVWKLHGQFDALCDIAEDLKLKKETKESDIKISTFLERNFTSFVEWYRQKDPFVVRDAACKVQRNYFVAIFNKEQLNEFRHCNDEKLFFSHAERIRMVNHVCSILDIQGLMHRGAFTDAFPLHQGPLKKNRNDPPVNLRQNLQHDWANWHRVFKYQPIQAIKNYFGEKIGLYFAWLGFYTSLLVPAAVVGLLCFLFGVARSFSFIPAQEICDPKNEKLFYQCPLCDKYCSYFSLKSACVYTLVSHFFDNNATVFFAVFMSIWATIFLEFWKRKQASLSYEWHTRGYEEEEAILRPEYVRNATTLERNLITQKMEPYMPKYLRIPRILGALGVVLFFVALVISSLVGVIVYRAVIYGVLLSQHNSLIQSRAKIIVSATAATINLIVINVMRLLYSRIAKTLTNWENPRTLSDYENSFTLKMFWFQFVNTYSSAFYVAFFKNAAFIGRPGHFERFGAAAHRLEGCAAEGCFLELCVQIIVIMVGQQVVGNTGEVIIPLIKEWYNKRLVKEPYVDLPQWEKDFDLNEREDMALFWEYLEMVLQYGFVTMFVAAFPLAPLFALLNNILEIRVDAINFLCHYRRPVSHRAEDIGVWYAILTTLTEMSVLVNALVIAFTSDFIPRLVYIHIFSKDGSLRGYVNYTLSYFNVSDFNDVSKPQNPTLNLPYVLPMCRYRGYYEPQFPYNHSNTYFLILSVRLGFVFLFQWLITGFTRLLAWYIPDVPSLLKVKMKRENYLAHEASKNFKERRGVRKRRNLSGIIPIKRYTSPLQEEML